MNDLMVSVRMPESLLLELKRLARQHHFLDLSEEIRSIVRKRWVQHTGPEIFELKRLREDIKEEIKRKSMRKVTDEVNKELNRIRQQLKNEELVQ